MTSPLIQVAIGCISCQIMTTEVQVTTREAALNLLLKKGESSARDLAFSVGVSVQAMRRHLRSLEVEGFVESTLISLGPGRPSNLWQLTIKGRNFFNDGTERFALDLMGLIEANLAPEKVEGLLNQQALEKASSYRHKIGEGDISERLAKLVELRNQEGYLADYQVAENGMSWFLNEFTCSISGIAEKYHSVCDQELQLIRYTFPDCKVERVQWRIEFGHSCGFEITPLKLNE